jgi:hypothetical protein
MKRYHKDPLFFNLRNNDDFKRIAKKVDDFYEFRKKAFGNAINRLDASKELKNFLK